MRYASVTSYRAPTRRMPFEDDAAESLVQRELLDRRADRRDERVRDAADAASELEDRAAGGDGGVDEGVLSVDGELEVDGDGGAVGRDVVEGRHGGHAEHT